MSKKKQEIKTYILTGWSEQAIQPVIDRFAEVTGFTDFPITATESTDRSGPGKTLVKISNHNYALAYFQFEQA